MTHFDRVVNPELALCDTPEQMLEVLMKHYHLDCKLGTITHLAFRQGLKAAVNMVNPKVKFSAVSH
jgi:hypothetical protein